MEAARRIDEWSRIEARVPHLGVVPRLADADSQHGMLDLTPFEWEVIATVDGTRDLRAIAEVLGRAEFEIARTIFGLTSTGVVVLDDPTQVAASPDTPDVTQLVARAEEQLALGRRGVGAAHRHRGHRALSRPGGRARGAGAGAPGRRAP